MKNNIVLLSFIMFATVSSAANLIEVGAPICCEGRQWVYEMRYDTHVQYEGKEYDRRKKSSMTIMFEGDTIINGFTYKKCWRKYGVNDVVYPYNTDISREISDIPEVIGYCRDTVRFECNEVYVIYTEQYKNEIYGYNAGTINALDNKDLYLLWSVPQNFSLNSFSENDSYAQMYKGFLSEIRLLNVERENEFNFQSAEIEKISGEERLKLVADIGYSEDSYSYWIDGIGYVIRNKGMTHSCVGLANNLISPNAGFRDLGIQTYLSHVVEDGEIVYKTPDFQEWLVPASETNDVKVTTLPSDDSYYNMQGQRVSEPAAGIYIHNGKKIFVK